MRERSPDEQQEPRSTPAPQRSVAAVGVLGLQALAGNRAVGSLVHRSAAGGSASPLTGVQRLLALDGKTYATRRELTVDAAAWKAWSAWADPDKSKKLDDPDVVHDLPPVPVAAVEAAVGAGAGAGAPAAAAAAPAPVSDWPKRRDAALADVRAEVRRAVDNPKTKASGNFYAGGLTVSGIPGAEREKFNKFVRRTAQREGWGGPGLDVKVVWGKLGKGSNFNVWVGTAANPTKWNVHFIY